MAWQQSAACRGPLGAVFFPPSSTERKREKAAREAHAKRICEQCPVIVECRTYAIEVGEAHGVWGGLGEKERRVMISN